MLFVIMLYALHTRVCADHTVYALKLQGKGYGLALLNVENETPKQNINDYECIDFLTKSL